MFLSLRSPGIFEWKAVLASELPLDGIGDVDSTGLRKRLKPGRNIHTLAEQIVALHHHVAEVYSDPKDDTPLGGNVLLVGRYRFLQCNRAGYRVDHGAEFHNGPVAQ